ncbi:MULTISPECIES: lytic transglycosylase domain-containing protein [Giesbergeria]|uniref:Transglycosylase SLT domain-containing protein n=1 Tax=Giesbergeria sinuosa TaxID=80883 RepID=A0ABV9QGP3_9BURK
MTASGKWVSGVHTFATDVITGFLAITRNSFALVGLLVVFTTATLVARPDLRQAGEEQLIGWLQARQEALLGPIEPEPEPSDRTLAVNPKDLPKEQAKVAYWLSKKYRVAPEPLGLLVAEAYATGTRVQLDPTLILAIMAVESSFNPFAQSSVGAQGLMQVMTRVHTDKYERVGGKLAAFDPVTNLRVGVKVLMDCITRTGSVEGGLGCYVGAADMADDGGYAAKVLAEHARLRQVAGQRKAPTSPFPLLAERKPDNKTTTATPPAEAAAPANTTEKVALLSGL